MSQYLKSMLQAVINDRHDEANDHLHNYLVTKMRDASNPTEETEPVDKKDSSD